MRWVLGVLLATASPIACETCTCGYVLADDAHKSSPVLFTDRLETNFASLSDFNRNSAWTRQQFNVSAESGRGKYGKSFEVENVFSYAGPKVFEHQDAKRDVKKSPRAMGLRVGSIPTAMGAIGAAEIDSARTDMFWGSYRVLMRLTRASGTCAAFFWVWTHFELKSLRGVREAAKLTGAVCYWCSTETIRKRLTWSFFRGSSI